MERNLTDIVFNFCSNKRMYHKVNVLEQDNSATNRQISYWNKEFFPVFLTGTSLIELRWYIHVWFPNLRRRRTNTISFSSKKQMWAFYFFDKYCVLNCKCQFLVRYAFGFHSLHYMIYNYVHFQFPRAVHFNMHVYNEQILPSYTHSMIRDRKTYRIWDQELCL
jgi:hypothetical protein